jgi:hypothetical protein
MLKRTRLISLAAMAALIVSGSAPATAATSGHPKKVIHASKQVPQSTARRTGPASAPAQQAPGGTAGRSDRSGGRAASF